jgi:transcriptional regulator with XRE-family HTH domain
MLALSSILEAGKRLRAKREALHLSTRDVARLSRRIAEERGDQAFSVSHNWVSDVENGKFKPKSPKLYSLCLIYRCGINEILALFGLNPGDLIQEQGLIALPHTHLLGPGAAAPEPMMLTRLDLRSEAQLQRTNLAHRMVQGEIARFLVQQASMRHLLYGYVGTEDHTLDPILRPGSWVEIDLRQTKVTKGIWISEYDRPIYFVELRGDCYACCWCEVDGNNLLLVPNPKSLTKIRHVRYPQDAEILGRVTAIAMRIADLEAPHSSGSKNDPQLVNG